MKREEEGGEEGRGGGGGEDGKRGRGGRRMRDMAHVVGQPNNSSARELENGKH